MSCLTHENETLYLQPCCETSILWQNSCGQMGIENLNGFPDRLGRLVVNLKWKMMSYLSFFSNCWAPGGLVSQQYSEVLNVQNKTENV